MEKNFDIMKQTNFACPLALCSVQSRPGFCVIDVQYSTLMQDEIIVEANWCKKVTSYISSSKAAGNIKVNLKK